MKKLLKKLAKITLATSVILSGFAGIGSDTAEASRPGFDPKKVGGKVVLTSFADAVSLTPYTASDAASFDIQGMIFDSLISTDIKGQIEPNVATKWTFDKKTLTYTFDLRKDVKWHDGKKLTADDVVFTFDMYMHEKSVNSYKYLFVNIEDVTKVNDYKVKFKLKKDDVFFLYNIGGAILPKHVLKNIANYNGETAAGKKFARSPIGSGPFKFKEWRTAERIVVVANKDYWNGRPYMDQVITRILPDSNVEVINLLKGSVDFVEVVNAKSVGQVTKNKNLKVQKYDSARFDYIGWNLENPLFKDEKVRQALAYGLNRKGIVDKVFLKNGTLASGPFHPLLSTYNKNVKPYSYDTTKANKLLDEAGWKKGPDGIRTKDGKKFEIEVAYNQGNKQREAIAIVAQQDWKKLGIKVTPRSYEWSIYLDRVKKGTLDAYVLAWGLGTSGNQYGLWHSVNAPDSKGVGGLNRSRIKDKEIDRITEAFQLEHDPAKRNKLYHELHKIMSEKQYNLFTHHPSQYAGFDKDLAGIKISLWNAHYNLEDWYWANPKKRK